MTKRAERDPQRYRRYYYDSQGRQIATIYPSYERGGPTGRRKVFRYRLIGGNGEQMAPSEGYYSAESAERGLRDLAQRGVELSKALDVGSPPVASGTVVRPANAVTQGGSQMGDQNKGQDQSAAAREAAQARRTEAGKEAKAFGPGGNPLKQDETGTWVDETTGAVVTNPVDENGNPVS